MAKPEFNPGSVWLQSPWTPLPFVHHRQVPTPRVGSSCCWNQLSPESGELGPGLAWRVTASQSPGDLERVSGLLGLGALICKMKRLCWMLSKAPVLTMCDHVPQTVPSGTDSRHSAPVRVTVRGLAVDCSCSGSCSEDTRAKIMDPLGEGTMGSHKSGQGTMSP